MLKKLKIGNSADKSNRQKSVKDKNDKKLKKNPH